ncbi:hypothetical protein NWF24_27265 [Variovorax paradoxus]|uniref:hypothetical protein n=1 Tax=Variovorax paradoxus TaxID=34073 RepID=UPI0021AC20A0|nr:hypothetical protein [Variovorax paradoxus]UVH56512.1 hypothetical protein NWF24_27265 [Variovorax paradoxus]
MPILKPINIKDVLQHAGVDIHAVLGASTSPNAPHWTLTTPIGDAKETLSGTKFYRSISEYVDDEDKRIAFATSMMGITAAAAQQNYQAVLKGSYVQVKVAHEFKYGGSNHKLWELKPNNKDRVYFFTHPVAIQTGTQPVISMLLAHHKKDQTTPKEVSKYCETLMKSYLDPTAKTEILKE